MELLNLFCYIITALAIAFVIFSLLIVPLIRKKQNDKDIQQGRGELRFFKFEYSGPVFIEHITYDRAANQFKGFKNDQQKILKSYNKKPKRNQVRKINNKKS